MNTYVPIFRGLDARGGRKLRTDTHTHTNTRDNYSNPRCAHARRGLIRQSGALIDDEKYQLLTTEQDGLADDDLDTRYFCVTGGRKRKQIRFQRRDVGFKIINGYVMVLIKIIKEGGACHAFCSFLEVKRQI